MPTTLYVLRKMPKTSRVKYSTLSAANQPNPCQSGLFYVVEGLADLSRIGRLEKIDGDWLSLPSPCQAANAMPMRQSGTNPMPIESPFWIGEISPIHGHRGQSCSIPIPIRYQSRLRPKHCMLPIRYQSATNQLPIRCRCQADSQCSGVNPLPIDRQSSANSPSIDVDPVPI